MPRLGVYFFLVNFFLQIKIVFIIFSIKNIIIVYRLSQPGQSVEQTFLERIAAIYFLRSFYVPMSGTFPQQCT